MKPNRIFTTLSLWFFFNLSFGQAIIDVSYFPEYPTLEDTIGIRYTIQYGTNACFQDSNYSEQLLYGQFYIESYTCCGPIGAGILTYHYDTVYVFPDFSSPWMLDVFISSGYTTKPPCTGYPIYSGGDTAAFPIHMEHIEVPVGFFASTQDIESGISIFPNPVNNELNIRFENDIVNCEIKMYDLTGRLTLSQANLDLSQVVLDVSTLPNGSYILEINSDNQKIRRKILVAR